MMFVMVAGDAVVADPVGACTWNPLDKNTLITLSNSNRNASKAAGGSGYTIVRGNLYRSSGDRYFTAVMTAVAGGFVSFGVASASVFIDGGYLGQHTSGVFKKSTGIISSNGIVYHNMTGAASNFGVAAGGNGTVIGIRVNFTNFTVKFYNDTTGVLLGTLADGAPWPALFPAVALWPGGALSDLNCAGPFGRTLDVGETAWDA
jgi:hypothetical protein